MTTRDDVIDGKSPRKLDVLRSDCRFNVNSSEEVSDFLRIIELM